MFDVKLRNRKGLRIKENLERLAYLETENGLNARKIEVNVTKY